MDALSKNENKQKEEEEEEEDSDSSMSVNKHKIVFVGDEGVGKTVIFSRITDNTFNEVYEPSIGVDYMSKIIKFRGNRQNCKCGTHPVKKNIKI